MMKMKKLLALLLVLCMTFQTALPAAAAEVATVTTEATTETSQNETTTAEAVTTEETIEPEDVTATSLTMGEKPADGSTEGNPFPKGTAGSNSFRIPAMVTLKDGTLVAAADARWNTTYDGGGLDTIVSRSTDDGATWKYTFANYLGDNGNQYNGSSSTAFIDPCLATDGNTVYMLCDLYPYGVALNGSGNTAPSTEVGFTDAGYLKLSNDDGKTYNYYTTGGKIYNSNGTVVEGYEVDAKFNIAGNNVNTNLFFSDSPYKVVRTGYLYLTSSTDGGATWSDPMLLPNIKTSSEQVCLVGPGSGLVLNDGTIIFPVYSYNGNANSQRTGFIYSTDDGKNWSRTDGNIEWSSESSIVAVDTDLLRVFYRNGNKQICYVDVTKVDGTYTWGTEQKTGVACNSNTQLSAIAYGMYVFISCPGNESDESGAAYRKNGRIFTFTLNDDNSMSLNKTTEVNDGSFMYSSLALIDDNMQMAILYEDCESKWGTGEDCYYTMSFKTYDVGNLVTMGSNSGVEDDGQGDSEDNTSGGSTDIATTTVNVTLKAGETSTTYTASENSNEGSAGTTTSDDVVYYEQVGTDEVAGGTTYTKTTVAYSTLAGDNKNWTKTDYYHKVNENEYYPVYAKKGYYYYYYYGYSPTDSSSNVTEISSTTDTSKKVTVYTATTTNPIPASTTITFTGLSAGTTSVTVGSTTYNITVTSLSYEETKHLTFGKQLTLTPDVDVPTVGNVTYSTTYEVTEGSDLITLSDGTVTANDTAGTATVKATVALSSNQKEYATYVYTIEISDMETHSCSMSMDEGKCVTIGNETAGTEGNYENLFVELSDGETVEWKAEDSSVVGVAGIYNTTSQKYGNTASVVGYNAGTTKVYGVVKNADGTPVKEYIWNVTVNEVTPEIGTERTINIKVTKIENCEVYYSINGGELIKVNEGEVVVQGTVEQKIWNIMFFAAPKEGYALTYMYIPETDNQYYCLSDGNIDGTGSSAWPLDDDGGYKNNHGFRWSLMQGNMTVDQMKVMFTKALEYGCDGTTTLTKNNGQSVSAMDCQFVAQKLPDVDKKIKAVNGASYEEGKTIVELGDTIVYQIDVTRYATNTTYGTITYNNESLTDELTNNNGITNPDMGTSSTTKQRYSYDSSLTLTLDNYDNVVKDGTIINTVNFSYDYISQYSTGTLSSSASAEAKIDVSLPEYVVDFGLPLGISDMGILGDLTIVGGSATYGSVTPLENGKGFTYKPNSVLKGVDYVTLNLSENKSYAVRIYPATTVYYEESFATPTGFISTGTSTSKSQQAAEAGANQVSNYGYDQAYAGEQTGLSAGTALVSSTVGDKVGFAFTGTGVDVYANTSPTSGKATILVRDNNGTLKKMMLVETAMVKGTSSATENQAVTAYNVPIANIDMSKCGDYSITIINTQSKTEGSTNTISIDGFRVYNTLGNTANDTYALDDEENPVYTELRNHVLSALDVEANTNEQYADQIANDAYSQVYSSADVEAGAVIIDSTDRNSLSYSVESGSAQDLLDNGPKNELYLYPGQTVTFKLNYDAQIGLKALNKTVTYSISDGSTDSTDDEKTLTSSTDMFYKVSKGTVTITNNSDTDSNAILSITKIKVTGITEDSAASTSLFAALTADDLVPALLSLGYQVQEPEIDDDTPTNPGDETTDQPSGDTTESGDTSKPSDTTEGEKPSGGTTEGDDAKNDSKVDTSNAVLTINYVTTKGKKVDSVKITKEGKTGETVTYTANQVKKLAKDNLPKGYVLRLLNTYKKVQIKYGNSASVKVKVVKVTTPKKASFKKAVSSKKKQMTVTWKKVSNASGYKISYSTDKTFKKNVKTVTVKGNKTFSKTIKGLKAGKTYYVKVRAYKTAQGQNVYGSYSKVKTVKIKKK